MPVQDRIHLAQEHFVSAKNRNQNSEWMWGCWCSLSAQQEKKHSVGSLFARQPLGKASLTFWRWTIALMSVRRDLSPDKSFSSIKNPASERHLIETSWGNRSWKLSQCSSAARLPAEQPVSKACLAVSIPFAMSSSTTASQMRNPLKKSLVPSWSSPSASPANDAPSQYLITTIFQLWKSDQNWSELAQRQI